MDFFVVVVLRLVGALTVLAVAAFFVVARVFVAVAVRRVVLGFLDVVVFF